MTPPDAPGPADPDLVHPAVARVGEQVPDRADRLTQRAEAFARGARATVTWKAYDGKWRRFSAWCTERGEPSLPAAPLTVARFLTGLAREWRPPTPTDPPAVVIEGQALGSGTWERPPQRG